MATNRRSMLDSWKDIPGLTGPILHRLSGGVPNSYEKRYRRQQRIIVEAAAAGNKTAIAVLNGPQARYERQNDRRLQRNLKRAAAEGSERAAEAPKSVNKRIAMYARVPSGGGSTPKTATTARSRGMVVQTGRAGTGTMYTAAREVKGMGSVSATGATRRQAEYRLKTSLGEQGG